MSELAPNHGLPAPPVAPSSDGDGLADVSDLCFRLDLTWRREKNAPAALPGPGA